MITVMESIREKLFVSTVLFVFLCITGCTPAVKRQETEAMPREQIIGSLGEIYLPGAIRVEGYGIVASLDGTGSAECPPDIRRYLRQYILKQATELDANKLINSLDTAVVVIEGVIPQGCYKGQRFDLTVKAIEGSQTTSLRGGWLYSSDLKAAGRLGSSVRVLARAKGAVFIDPLGDEPAEQRSAYVLGGGRVLEEYDIRILLREGGYRLFAEVRDRINEKFGDKTAQALSPNVIGVEPPEEYKRRKRKFQSLLQVIPLYRGSQVQKKKIIQLVARMSSSESKIEAETRLEAIGRACLPYLSPLLNSSDEQVRLHTARCMLNLGSDKGLQVLREIALDKDSIYRLEALQAIRYSATRKNAAAISRWLVRDEDFEVRFAAYRNLIELDDIIVSSEFIGRKFYLDQVAQSGYKGIYVTRSGEPRLAIFGAPIYCRKDVFIQSTDKDVIINSPEGEQGLVILRKHPTRPNAPPIRVKSSFELAGVIRSMAEEPLDADGVARRGLNITYAEIIALLKQMCDKGAIDAEFRAGPLPEIGL